MAASGKYYWLYGQHACLAALQNPQRHITRVLVTAKTHEIYEPYMGRYRAEIVEAKAITSKVSDEAIHQGIALEVAPLPHHHLEDIAISGKPLLMLDQVTDPHNVGAILRSAAAFDAGGVIMHDRNAPTESGVMARAASGALEMVPLVYVTNLSQAMATLQSLNYWCIGLDGTARQSLRQAKLGQKTVLVMGAEGKGLRELTRKRCDGLIKLPIHPQMESLNVSNAAAIALYELYSLVSNM